MEATNRSSARSPRRLATSRLCLTSMGVLAGGAGGY